MQGAISRNQEGQPRTPTKTEQLRALLTSPYLEFLMEAHNGLSAKIVEEAGFKGIWASGLSMSAALGVRDNNEASWTQIMDVLEFMVDATRVPILVDGDTGWGNFNNMRRAVTKLCQRGVAGICIEDKLFPKTNSFLGENQPLADIDEFCGKIKAGKDSQLDDSFSIVARLEAFIAGHGLAEALKRAEAYHAAGADALLVHSKLSTAEEIQSFSAEWGGRCPIVIVPTKYFRTPTDDFRKAGISVAIWANHNLRAAITTKRETSAQIFREESLAGVDGNMVLVKEVFELTGNDELAEAEKKYLPQQGGKPMAVVLAASRGEQLGALTEDWVRDLVKCSRPFSGDYLDDEAVRLSRIGNDLKDTDVDGEWIGVARLSPQGGKLVRAEIEAMGQDGSLQKSSLLDLFARLSDKGTEIQVIYVPGQWLDVDDAADFTKAGKFL